MTQGERDSSGGELSSFLHLTGLRPLALLLVAGLAGGIGVFLALGEPATFQARYVLNVDRVADNDLAIGEINLCLLYTSPSPRDLSTSRMPSSA